MERRVILVVGFVDRAPRVIRACSRRLVVLVVLVPRLPPRLLPVRQSKVRRREAPNFRPGHSRYQDHSIYRSGHSLAWYYTIYTPWALVTNLGEGDAGLQEMPLCP